MEIFDERIRDEMRIIYFVIFMIAGSSVLWAQGDDNPWYEEDEAAEEYYYDTTKTMKGLALDLGYGSYGGSIAFGFRYSMFSLHMGFAGIFDGPPNYSYSPPAGVDIRPNEPLPSGYVAEEFTGVGVFGDVGFYLAYLRTLNFFVNVGYYSQQDTILARSPDGLYYRYGYKASDGLTFGGGAEYTVSRWFRLAAGFHTRRGVFTRLTYTWR